MQKERICEISLVVTALVLCAIMVGFIAVDNSRAVSAEVSYNDGGKSSSAENAAVFADSDGLSAEDVFADSTEPSTAAATYTAADNTAPKSQKQTSAATKKEHICRHCQFGGKEYAGYRISRCAEHQYRIRRGVDATKGHRRGDCAAYCRLPQ